MRHSINKFLERFLVLLMILMVLSVLWQIASRYVLSSPSSFTEELSRFLFIWIGVLGAAYASGQRTHLAITILPEKLDDEQRRKLYIVINFLIALFALTIMIIGGANLVYVNYSLGQFSAALGVPLSFVYGVVPISGVLVVYYKIDEIIHSKKYLI